MILKEDYRRNRLSKFQAKIFDFSVKIYFLENFQAKFRFKKNQKILESSHIQEKTIKERRILKKFFPQIFIKSSS